jgi:probable HAF family extracellular repeat protein
MIAAAAAVAVGVPVGPAEAVAPASATQADGYRVTDLGTLPGQPASFATAINDRGDVVGASGYRATLWRRGRIIDLGTLGGLYSRARDINGHGDVIGESRTATDTVHAFRWRNGRMIDLGTLPGYENSYATAVNDRGAVLGFSVGEGAGRPTLWRPDGTKVDLGELTGMDNVLGLDDTGRFVGSVSLDGMNSAPALWSAGRLTMLSGTPGTAVAINDRGDAAGYFVVGTAGSFFWHRGLLTEIPLVPNMPPASMMQAQALNNRGQVVGNSGVGGFVWKPGTLTMLPGLDGNSGTVYVDDINNHGAIVGSDGTAPETGHAVLLTPTR